MAKERNYQKEYDRQKVKDKIIACHVSPELANDFTAKVELEGKTKNKVIRDFIEQYTYGDEK